MTLNLLRAPPSLKKVNSSSANTERLIDALSRFSTTSDLRITTIEGSLRIFNDSTTNLMEMC